MPYLGNEAAEKFVSKPAVDQFSGDGSTTAFTLSFPVASDQDILVSVDGVIQDTTAYAVSNSTTLTFTAAPSSNSGNNIFVNYLARVSATVAHPSTSALAATTGTFTDDVNIDSGTLFVDASANAVGIGTTSPAATLTVAHASGSDGRGIRLVNSSNNQTYENRIGTQGVENTSYSIRDITQDAVRLSISNAGEVNMPSQPSFLAQPSSVQNNVGITDGTSVTIALGTERYDVGGNFASNTFTAPVTGKYLLSATVYILNIDSAAVYIQFIITTSNRSYFQLIDPDFGQDAVYWSFNHATVADMDANDTAYIQFAQYSGTIQADIQTETNFSGILVG
jgi:hypothetical protein